MKTFTMSQYSTLEHLYAAKADYYENVAMQLIDCLVENCIINTDTDGDYYWANTGEYIREEFDV